MTTAEVLPIDATQDPLALLPAHPPATYRKGETIYSHNTPSPHLHLVISGRVKVFRKISGRSAVIDLYGPDDFFGEWALLNADRASEEAVALENTEAMSWSKQEIENLVLEKPPLGVAMLQIMARRTSDLSLRLQSCLQERTAERVLQFLIHISERSGFRVGGGFVRLAPLAHNLISECTGTSREIVTLHMNRFRREGLLKYSRSEIVLSPLAFQVAEGQSSSTVRGAA
jgi:CRP/FNR family transcriptional regulator